ncbi:hypothetical protein JOB18_042891 [Solea senegalensis]|uniref:Uncharacterized protein n=1 Tax=Solea senegalensis TaxID=28829 RepID=A0AAV6SNU7_SOLSE|nr:hypothetical protein JOB18_042891 [Solea senegalensis]
MTAGRYGNCVTLRAVGGENKSARTHFGPHFSTTRLLDSARMNSRTDSSSLGKGQRRISTTETNRRGPRLQQQNKASTFKRHRLCRPEARRIREVSIPLPSEEQVAPSKATATGKYLRLFPKFSHSFWCGCVFPELQQRTLHPAMCLTAVNCGHLVSQV